jgi:hypothetical protein
MPFRATDGLFPVSVTDTDAGLKSRAPGAGQLPAFS